MFSSAIFKARFPLATHGAGFSVLWMFVCRTAVRTRIERVECRSTGRRRKSKESGTEKWRERTDKQPQKHEREGADLSSTGLFLIGLFPPFSLDRSLTSSNANDSGRIEEEVKRYDRSLCSNKSNHLFFSAFQTNNGANFISHH